jgi:hypothetical protein
MTDGQSDESDDGRTVMQTAWLRKNWIISELTRSVALLWICATSDSCWNTFTARALISSSVTNLPKCHSDRCKREKNFPPMDRRRRQEAAGHVRPKAFAGINRAIVETNQGGYIFEAVHSARVRSGT